MKIITKKQEKEIIKEVTLRREVTKSTEPPHAK